MGEIRLDPPKVCALGLMCTSVQLKIVNPSAVGAWCLDLGACWWRGYRPLHPIYSSSHGGHEDKIKQGKGT